MGLLEPTEVVEVRLSFLATRGEEDPPDLDGMVTSGGVIVDEMEEMEGLVEGKILGVERQIDRTPSPLVGVWFWILLNNNMRELWLRSGLGFWLLL